jgi:hypothetical protein
MDVLRARVARSRRVQAWAERILLLYTPLASTAAELAPKAALQVTKSFPAVVPQGMFPLLHATAAAVPKPSAGACGPACLWMHPWTLKLAVGTTNIANPVAKEYLRGQAGLAGLRTCVASSFSMAIDAGRMGVPLYFPLFAAAALLRSLRNMRRTKRGPGGEEDDDSVERSRRRSFVVGLRTEVRARCCVQVLPLSGLFRAHALFFLFSIGIAGCVLLAAVDRVLVDSGLRCTGFRLHFRPRRRRSRCAGPLRNFLGRGVLGDVLRDFCGAKVAPRRISTVLHKPGTRGAVQSGRGFWFGRHDSPRTSARVFRGARHSWLLPATRTRCPPAKRSKCIQVYHGWRLLAHCHKIGDPI